MKKIEEKKIEEAIGFLVGKKKSDDSFESSIPTLHPTRVAMYLDNLGYESNVVITAILHEMFEKNCAQKEEIEERFGKEILNLISALTPDFDIKDEYSRDKDMFKRCLDFGRETLIIKSAELLDESKYFHISQDKAKWLYLLGKMKYFNNLSNELIRNEKPWKDVNERYEKLKSTFIH